jgi:transposase
MPKIYAISPEQYAEIVVARKENRDKQVEKRLHAVQMRGEGKKNVKIGEQLETSAAVVSRWISRYVNGGLAALLPKHREARYYNLSYEEESCFLAEYEARAQAGQMVEVSEIKAAYQEKVGHTIGGGQIYRVLHRHDWRKVKPRSKHPKKATPEAIQASKKLTTPSRKRWKILQVATSD